MKNYGIKFNFLINFFFVYPLVYKSKSKPCAATYFFNPIQYSV